MEHRIVTAPLTVTRYTLRFIQSDTVLEHDMIGDYNETAHTARLKNAHAICLAFLVRIEAFFSFTNYVAVLRGQADPFI